MRILFVSQYADPNPIGGNNNVYRQARALKEIGVELEILTWARKTWSGPSPSDPAPPGVPCLEWDFEDLKYHITRLPESLMELVPSESDWRMAVDIGCELLRRINPDVVHLQHWRGLWWILESAGRLRIPTVYTAHDWGLGCARTILVKGDGSLCDGKVETGKCGECIFQGRNLVGKVNEVTASTALGERFFGLLGRLRTTDRFLSRYGAVRMGRHKRLELNLKRANTLLSKLNALIVANDFAKSFFHQFGVKKDLILSEPWYYDLPIARYPATRTSERAVLGFIGRISPEKGLERIFSALLQVTEPVHLIIAGVVKGEYAEKLHSMYPEAVGTHSVEWLGWLPHPEVDKFYSRIDAVLINSEWIDNTPLTLIESFAFKRPVIMTETPTTSEFVDEGITGWLVKMGSTESLAEGIWRFLRRKKTPSDNLGFPRINTSKEYAFAVKAVYEGVLSRLENRNMVPR